MSEVPLHMFKSAVHPRQEGQNPVSSLVDGGPSGAPNPKGVDGE